MQTAARSFAERFPLLHRLSTRQLGASVLVLAIVYALASYGRFGQVLASSDGTFTADGPMLGGDYVVFRTGARSNTSARMIANYDIAQFSSLLRARYPGHGDMMFAWPYPPSMYFLVRPLAQFSFLQGYLIWEGAFLLLFVVVLRRLWSNWRAVLLATASPAVLIAIITGQTGLLTASLLAICGASADRRPVLAGIAAGVLTLKPHYGVLIPIALVARGCWRAVASAVACVLLVVGSSLLVHGVALWQAFLRELGSHSELLAAAGRFPVWKLDTPYGAPRVLGATSPVALGVQVASSLLLAVLVTAIWRRVESSDLRAAALASAAALATPYGFYYEMVVLVPPLFLVAKHASYHGWLRGERGSLSGVWVLSILPPGPSVTPGVPVSFLVTAAAVAIVARRVTQEYRRSNGEEPVPARSSAHPIALTG